MARGDGGKGLDIASLQLTPLLPDRITRSCPAEAPRPLVPPRSSATGGRVCLCSLRSQRPLLSDSRRPHLSSLGWQWNPHSIAAPRTSPLRPPICNRRCARFVAVRIYVRFRPQPTACTGGAVMRASGRFTRRVCERSLPRTRPKRRPPSANAAHRQLSRV